MAYAAQTDSLDSGETCSYCAAVVDEPATTIFLSAAEASGDKHAAKLITQLRRNIPHVRCIGLGGPAMAQAGCSLIENLVNKSAMLLSALWQVPFYFQLLQRIRRLLRQQRQDIVILIDSPAWNFHLAKAATKLGIQVLYYIPPQLWAWGAWRTGKLSRWTDRIACIFPFEPGWFAERAVTADYVGHPLFDGKQFGPPDPPRSSEHPDFPTVALLPGSRRQEIRHLWQPMQQVAAQIHLKWPRARFLSAASIPENAHWLTSQADPELPIEIRHTSLEAVCRYADLALVASGTATLEVAAQQCPMIVMYHVNPVSWHLVGRWLVKTNYISLVNILADRQLVPEFVPFHGQTDAVTAKALEILQNDEQRHQTRSDMEKLMAPIVKPGAAANVAKIVEQMLPAY